LELAGVLANSSRGFLWRETRHRWLTAERGGQRQCFALRRARRGDRVVEDTQTKAQGSPHLAVKP
jgi:hypothetical protein